jgi:hypothetical protein
LLARNGYVPGAEFLESITLDGHLILAFAVALCHSAPAAAAPPAADFYVAPTGSDSASGSASAPFATLDRARIAVRDLKDKHRSSESTLTPSALA